MTIAFKKKRAPSVASPKSYFHPSSSIEIVWPSHCLFTAFPHFSKNLTSSFGSSQASLLAAVNWLAPAVEHEATVPL